MNTDTALFEFDAPNTFANLYEMANSTNDGADEYFDKASLKMQSAKSEPNLENDFEEPSYYEKNFQENKENFLPHDQFNDRNINFLAHQLIQSAKMTRTSKAFNRHSISVKGIELELPKIKHHAMINTLDELENTSKIDLFTRSEVKSSYKYEHIKSGSLDNLKLDKSSKTWTSFAEKVRNVFNKTPPRFHSKPTVNAGEFLSSSAHSKMLKSRKLFSFTESDLSNENKTIENKQIKSESDTKQIQNKQNVKLNIPSSTTKPIKPCLMKVLNSQDGVQVVQTIEIAHGGIKIPEKQLYTVPKPFSFESRKSCAVKFQKVNDPKKPWVFKARPATVLNKKPFIPKHEKKCTEPKKMFLNTERRAREWMIFDQDLKKKFSYYEEASKKKQEEMKEMEMNLIKRMRQQTIHKAEPIKKYKPVLIRKSERPITIPQSPKFSVYPVRSCSNASH